MSGKKRIRRNWSSEDKLRIVLEGMDPNVEVTALCRRENLHETQYYQWKNQLLGNADQVFRKQQTVDREHTELEQELTRMRSVIAEITAENLELKKTLSG